ncbi:hypothetical protein [Rhizobium sp. SL42]|uniref:hypothetical protein n=1 Tax=Rhizobium sp. SL42 TaxID=2806346 RepID=UPI001F33AAF8|nr:hypothetical protein [Rhizobium sp. SL42]UJW75840.1 hypothetical protein IM739_04905 [Rhizobium sp. SL42]
MTERVLLPCRRGSAVAREYEFPEKLEHHNAFPAEIDADRIFDRLIFGKMAAKFN